MKSSRLSQEQGHSKFFVQTNKTLSRTSSLPTRLPTIGSSARFSTTRASADGTARSAAIADGTARSAADEIGLPYPASTFALTYPGYEGARGEEARDSVWDEDEEDIGPVVHRARKGGLSRMSRTQPADRRRTVTIESSSFDHEAQPKDTAASQRKMSRQSSVESSGPAVSRRQASTVEPPAASRSMRRASTVGASALQRLSSVESSWSEANGEQGSQVSGLPRHKTTEGFVTEPAEEEEQEKVVAQRQRRRAITYEAGGEEAGVVAGQLSAYQAKLQAEKTKAPAALNPRQFLATLDKSTGPPVGLDFKADGDKLLVFGIFQNGLAELWNRVNHDNRFEENCQICAVNGLTGDALFLLGIIEHNDVKVLRLVVEKPEPKQATLINLKQLGIRLPSAGKTVVRKKDPKMFEEDLMPEPIKELTFWQAMNYFDVFDVMKQNTIDKRGFFNMMKGIMRDKGGITQDHSDAIFDEIDQDSSGQVDREEFLGWVFMTTSNYVSNVRKRLAVMEPSEVTTLFKKIDLNGNGTIDTDEFWLFIQIFSPGAMSREASDELHSYIDKDKSGEIDCDEFLNWVHPGRELRLILGQKDKETGYDRWEKQKNGGDGEVETGKSILKKLTAGQAAAENSKKSHSLMEQGPKQAVVLEFVIDKHFEATMSFLKNQLRLIFDASQIKFKIVQETGKDVVPNTCTKLTAHVGRGIVLWDRATMLAYQDNPFHTKETAQIWIRDVLVKCLPDVLGAANLRRAKKVAKMKNKRASMVATRSLG